MPISATGSKARDRQRGFTLIELMIVIAIIGVVSATVILAFPDPRGRLVDEAERFAARAAAARDEAVIGGRDVALWVRPDGYGFEERRRARWQPITEKPLREARWGTGTAAAGSVPRVIFDTTGLSSEPMAVTLARDGARVTVSIGMDGAVDVGA